MTHNKETQGYLGYLKHVLHAAHCFGFVPPFGLRDDAKIVSIKSTTLCAAPASSQYRRRKQMISGLPEAASAKRQMQQVAISWDPKKNTPLLGKTVSVCVCAAPLISDGYTLVYPPP